MNLFSIVVVLLTFAPFTPLVFVPSWVTVYAVFKVGYSLFTMLALDVGGSVFVTAIAGID
jgi:hypothetical protein